MMAIANDVQCIHVSTLPRTVARSGHAFVCSRVAARFLRPMCTHQQLYKHSTVNFLSFSRSLARCRHSYQQCISFSGIGGFSFSIANCAGKIPFWIIFLGENEITTIPFTHIYVYISSQLSCEFIFLPICVCVCTQDNAIGRVSNAALPKSPSPTMITFNNFVTKHCCRPFRRLFFLLFSSFIVIYTHILYAIQACILPIHSQRTQSVYLSTRPFLCITYISMLTTLSFNSHSFARSSLSLSFCCVCLLF